MARLPLHLHPHDSRAQEGHLALSRVPAGHAACATGRPARPRAQHAVLRDLGAGQGLHQVAHAGLAAVHGHRLDAPLAVHLEPHGATQPLVAARPLGPLAELTVLWLAAGHGADLRVQGGT